MLVRPVFFKYICRVPVVAVLKVLLLFEWVEVNISAIIDTKSIGCVC